MSALIGFHADPLSWSNWNLEMLVFVEGGKNQRNQRNTLLALGKNQQHTYVSGPELNLDHIGGRRVFSPLHHPYSPQLVYFFGLLI